MVAISDPAWIRIWGGLRAWRLWSIVVALGAIPAVFMFAPLAGRLMPGIARGIPSVLVVCILVGIFARGMWTSRCPRCSNAFGGWLGNPWPERCSFCALPAFGDVSLLAQPYSPLPVLGGRTLNPSIRKVLAIVEVTSGLALTGLVLWFVLSAGAFGGWIGIAFESYAILTIAAGVLLWRNAILGFELSEALQWLQVVRFQISAFSFVAVAGPEVLFIWSERGPGYYLGLHATLILGRPTLAISYIAVNLVPILILILLRKGRLAMLADARVQTLQFKNVLRPPNEELKPTATPSSLVE